MVEPLDNELMSNFSSTDAGSGVPTPLIGSSQLVSGRRDIRKKSSMSSMTGISMDKKTNNKVSTSLQSLPGNIYGSFRKPKTKKKLKFLAGRNLGSSILHENSVSGTYSEDELPLPTGWEMETTPDGILYYVDHNNKRTHWIHPFAAENLKPGWVKIFDQIHGIVYYKYAFTMH